MPYPYPSAVPPAGRGLPAQAFYRSARALCVDLLWTTRRFPHPRHGALAAAIRWEAQTLLRRLQAAWQHRHVPRVFAYHQDRAVRVCERLHEALQAAGRAGCLTPDELVRYLALLDDVTTQLDRLSDPPRGPQPGAA